MHDFCFYDRAYFEMQLTGSPEEIDEMASGIMTPPKKEDKVIQEGSVIDLKESDFIDKDKSISEKSEKIEYEKLLVTPLTPFSQVLNFLNLPSTDFHENPDSKSKFYALQDGVIFEVFENQIATIQLF